MPNFQIETLESVEYDFRPLVDAHGIIPEPSEARIRAFVSGMAGYTGESLEDNEVPEEGGGESGYKMLERMAEHRPDANKAVAEFCSGFPSEEEVGKLPFRVFLQFVNYLRDSVMNPEVLGGDSTPQSPNTTSPSTSTSEKNTDSPSPPPEASIEQSTQSSIAG